MSDRRSLSPRLSFPSCLLALAALPAALALPGCLDDVSGQQPPSRNQCRLAADCKDPAAAICDPTTYTCRPCRGTEDDARCRERDAQSPVCGAGGVCGVCAGTGESDLCAARDAKQPTCGAGKCGPCVQPADCQSGVCQPDGSCAKAADVVFVDNKNGTCSSGMSHAGTREDPLCEIQAGADRARMDRKPIVRIAGSRTPYAPVTVNATSTLDLILSGVPAGQDPVLVRGDGPGLTILGAASPVVVTAQGLDLSSTSGDAVLCDQRNGTVAPTLTLRASRLFEAKGAGLAATKCKVTVDGVRVLNNNNGGVRLSASTYDVQNLMVYGNSRAPAVTIDAAQAGSSFRFATIAYNVFFGTAAGVDCGGQPVEIQHSIVASNVGSASQFRGCKLTNVVTGAEMISGGTQKTPEFVSAVDPLDLHLKNGPASRDCCIDKVPAASGLPVRDLDGTRRPQGAALDIGAHEVAQ